MVGPPSDKQNCFCNKETSERAIMNEKRQIEEKIYQAKLDLRKVKEKKRKEIERLESRLRNFCTLPGPILILVLAVLVGIRRSVMRKMYISHASDA